MAAHGKSNRGLEAGAMPGMGYGRFGRLFPDDIGPVFPLEATEALADAMVSDDTGSPITEAEPEDENPTITSGYTYFGQFVDHDITFDPTPLNQQLVDVNALEDFRSPALDLDCVYGSGPDDQPYLYDKQQHLRLGRKLQAPAAKFSIKQDLLRLDDGTAILGDKRNDENKIVAQLQATFISLHNRLIADDAILKAVGGDLSTPQGRFRAAVTAARWHYQWVVLWDYLAKRICAPGVVEKTVNVGGTPILAHYTRPNYRYAYMPIEFSGAAYRFGHSIVRPSYALNKVVISAGADVTHKNRIPVFGPETNDRLQNLNGFGSIPEVWGIDWAFFLPEIPTDVPSNLGFKIPQPSYRLDAVLSFPLKDLPEFAGRLPNIARSLAFLNLSRGSMLRLPTGEQVAARLGVTALPAEVLWSAGSKLARGVPEPLSEAAEKRSNVFESNKLAFAQKTPLWYYVLREAEYFGVERNPREEKPELGGQHLGPIGSQIVAETLIGLLWEDASSILNQPSFRPVIAHDPAKGFQLSDLIKYALGGG